MCSRGCSRLEFPIDADGHVLSMVEQRLAESAQENFDSWGVVIGDRARCQEGDVRPSPDLAQTSETARICLISF